MYEDKFTEGNYKRTFEREVDWLLGRDLELQHRLQAVEKLTETYVVQTGNGPDGKQLSRLADYLLLEDLKDRHPDKVTRTDFPFLSKGQQRLRGRREINTDTSWMTVDVKFRLNGRRKTIRKKQV